MLIGVVLLLLPIVLLIAAVPCSRWLMPALRRVYLIVASLIAIPGSAFSLWLAGYTGDQGGIAAFYFQLLVLMAFILVTVSVFIANWLFSSKQQHRDNS